MSAKLGLGNAIISVGLVSFCIAILAVWLLPETNGKVIVEELDDNDTLDKSALSDSVKIMNSTVVN